MIADIDSKLAESIDSAKTYASSDNIRCGKNRMMVSCIRSQVIENDKGKQDMAFIELVPLTSEPNPQVEGDREGFTYNAQTKTYTPGTGRMLDDGNNPNRVGTPCAVKVNFTTNETVAAGRIKEFFLAAFNLRQEDLKKGDIGRTWKDASRQKAGWFVKGWVLNGNVVPAGTEGAVEGDVSLVAQNGMAMPVTKDTPGAYFKEENPLRGFVIDVITKNKKKRTPNEKGAYVNVQNWICVSPPGSGENTIEKMRARLADHKPGEAEDVVDDDGAEAPAASTAAVTPQVAVNPAQPPQVAPAVAPAPAAPAPVIAAPSPPAAPVAPPSPPAPPAAPVQMPWPPPAPWEVGGPAHPWLKDPQWMWKPGLSEAVSVANYLAGKVQ